MALIVEYHVIADMYPVSSTGITAGMIVSLNAAGQAIPAPTTLVGNAQKAIGIAGDTSNGTEGQTTAYSDQVVLGADGAGTRWTENRVPDFYNETIASQKITVYNGGGKFWISTDLFDGDAAVVPGRTLTTSNTTAGEWEDASDATNDDIVAVAVGPTTQYPSGVPGTDVDGHINLGDYIPVVLRL